MTSKIFSQDICRISFPLISRNIFFTIFANFRPCDGATESKFSTPELSQSQSSTAQSPGYLVLCRCTSAPYTWAPPTYFLYSHPFYSMRKPKNALTMLISAFCVVISILHTFLLLFLLFPSALRIRRSALSSLPPTSPAYCQYRARQRQKLYYCNTFFSHGHTRIVRKSRRITAYFSQGLSWYSQKRYIHTIRLKCRQHSERSGL